MQTGDKKAAGATNTDGSKQAANNVPDYDQDASLNAAKAYHARGWQVIPVLGAKYEDKNSGKKPLEKGWPDSRLTPDDFHRYWGDGQYKYNVGILTGAPSGIVVLDFDDGAVFRRWAQNHPDALETFTVRRSNAPEGRLHLYFRANNPPRSTSGSGWDLQSTRKQVVAPPSRHYTGGQYEVAKDLALLPWNDEYLASVSECTEGKEAKEGSESIEPREQEHDISMHSLHSLHSLTPAKVIEDTMPTQVGQRERLVFNLARGLKLDCGLSLDKCRPWVRKWQRQALPVIGTKEWGVTWSDFVAAYPNVKQSLAADSLQCAFDRVRTEDIMATSFSDYGLKIARFAVLCRELARLDEGCVFFIAVNKGGEIFDVAPTQVSRWLRMLEADGLTELVTAHTTKKAKRYRWIGPMCELATSRLP